MATTPVPKRDASWKKEARRNAPRFITA